MLTAILIFALKWTLAGLVVAIGFGCVAREGMGDDVHRGAISDDIAAGNGRWTDPSSRWAL